MFPSRKLLCRGLVVAVLLAGAHAQAEPAMWMIKNKRTTIYLLGAFHLLRPETVWNVPKIKKAAAQSKELWLEIPLDSKDTSVFGLMHDYGFDSNRSLAEKLTPEQHAHLERVAAEYTFPMELLDKMRPWYAGITLTMMPVLKAGYNPMAGVEMLLAADARIHRRAIKGFETMEEQIKLLSDLPEADQIDLLMQSLEEIDKGVERLREMENAWSQGDLKVLETDVEEMQREAPMAYRQLIAERNARWSEQIEKMSRGSGVKFIAVGTLHLVGPDSVQAQLAQRGIKVIRY